MYDNGPTQADIQFKAPPVESPKIKDPIIATGDALWGLPLETRNAGSWQTGQIVSHEQQAINDKLKSADPRITSTTVSEAYDLRKAVREGGDTLKRYIESKGDRIELSFDKAHTTADSVPDKEEGQAQAIDLIVTESESIKLELSGEMTPDRRGKLEKLAGFTAMLEGIAGNNNDGLKHLKMWLEEKSAEVAKAVELKQQELGLEVAVAKQIIESPQNQLSITPQNRQLQENASRLLKFDQDNKEKEVKLNAAKAWAVGKPTV